MRIFTMTVKPGSTVRETFTDRAEAAKKAAELIEKGYDINATHVAPNQIVVNGER